MSGETLNTMTDGKPSVIIYETGSGVVAHITPLNLATLKAIQVRAADLHPYPDKAPYQKPEENAFVEGQMTAAEDNPEYIAACKVIDVERAQWADRTIFSYAVKFPKYPTRESLVAAFSDKLSYLRGIAELPEDDYEATLHHLVLTWEPIANRREADYVRCIQLACQTIALTPDEVTAGIRFFRPVLPERAAGAVARPPRSLS